MDLDLITQTCPKQLNSLSVFGMVCKRSVCHQGHDTSGILSPTKTSGFLCASLSLLDTGNDAADDVFLSTVQCRDCKAPCDQSHLYPAVHSVPQVYCSSFNLSSNNYCHAVLWFVKIPSFSDSHNSALAVNPRHVGPLCHFFSDKVRPWKVWWVIPSSSGGRWIKYIPGYMLCPLGLSWLLWGCIHL